MSWDAGAVVGSLKLNISEYAEGMIEATGLMQAFPSLVVEFLENPLIGVAAAAREAGHALAEMIVGVMHEGQAMELAAQKAGLTIDYFSRLSWAAKTVNVSTEQLLVGLRMLQLHAADAATGNKEAADSFASVGISTQFLAAHLNNSQAVLEEVIRHIDRLPSSAERTSAAIHLLGRSGSELGPLLSLGSAAIDEIGNKAEAFGALENEESAAMGAAWRRAEVEMDMAWSGIKKVFAEQVAPVLLLYMEELLNWCQQHLPEIREQVEGAAQAVIRAINLLGPTILFLIQHLDLVLAALGGYGLIRICSAAAVAVESLGGQFLILAERIGVATAAQEAFSVASAATKYGGAGAVVGGVTTGGIGGTVGGGIGGILGALLGSLILPGIGTWIGSLAGGWAGGKIGGAIENHYHTQVTAQFDPHEAANQFAAKVVPVVHEQYRRQSQALIGVAQHQRVARATGGKGPSHYYAGM